MSRFSIIYKALKELGPQQLGLYAWYQFGLYSGHLRRSTNAALKKTEAHPERLRFNPPLNLPGQDSLIATLGKNGIKRLMEEAEEILTGKVRLFGSQPVSLELTCGQSLHPWPSYEINSDYLNQLVGDKKDIKYIWEPGRFGWAYTLGRAYYLSGSEKYAESFWGNFEKFLDANPPYHGPFWVSAQEVALRLIALVFALQVFWSASPSTAERRSRLKEVICEHAARIPPTLAYARAQNNNHLLSESTALITAGTVLPNHPSAQKWRSTGWRLFNQAIQDQIADDGTYIQHSTNYHRLMLQISLWVLTLDRSSASPNQETRSASELSPVSLAKLKSAVRWLFTILDEENGKVPNLGPNDGAYILPLTICPFEDYRPVLQAAACAILGERPLSPGPWDEMNLWIGSQKPDTTAGNATIAGISIPSSMSPHVLRIPDFDSWCYMRVAHFNARPGHADQLHVDLWWRGYNIAQDAGTYLYNADPPWDNALSHTDVHNTLMVNNLDQMNRVGRFLYLDWAQSHLLQHEKGKNGQWERVTAQHVGYNRLGVTHRRQAAANIEGKWIIEDTIIPSDTNLSKKFSPYRICLHWLLPDWPWEIQAAGLSQSSGVPADELDPSADLPPADYLPITLTQQSLKGLISVRISTDHSGAINGTQVARAGQLLFGEGQPAPHWGWVSPTFGVKSPAISLRVCITASELPVTITSLWTLPRPET